MKPLLKISPVALLAFMLSCQPATEKQTLFSLPENNEEPSLYAVPKSKMETDTQHFANVSREIFAKAFEGNPELTKDLVPIRAFTIRSIDLLEVMGLPIDSLQLSSAIKYNHARIYLGLDSNNQFKLYLTPVVNAELSEANPKGGQDLFLSGSFKGATGEVQEGEYVMDFSAPCPKTCPEPETPKQ